jgi:hypothetical protein
LPLALALLISVQSNSTTVSDAMRQQAIAVATQAIQLAEKALNNTHRWASFLSPIF